MFDAEVYPLLLHDCAFSECHGAPHRFFQVFGPGRTRLPGHPADPQLVQREHTLSYRYAASMLLPPAGAAVQRMPLLIKPLAVSAGGASHKGIDVFKRNVFQSTSDPRYLTLWRWAQTRFAAPVQTPPAAGGGAPPPTDLGATGADAPQNADVGPPLTAAGATGAGQP